jgi:hypothetical protein
MNKALTIIMILIIIIFVGWGAIKIILQEVRGRKYHLDQQYHGVVYEIKHFYGDRGLPAIRVDTNWINPGTLDADVLHLLKIGDSIVKNTGSHNALLFRKNVNGIWELKTISRVL